MQSSQLHAFCLSSEMEKGMIKIFLVIIFCLLLVGKSEAIHVSTYFDYEINSSVTEDNLDGNLNAIRNVINGNLDNDNTAEGYSFYEVLGVLPPAGTSGRTVFYTVDKTLNFDTGSEWYSAITLIREPVQGDLVYFDGSHWVSLPKNETATRYLANTGTTGNPAWNLINLVNGVTDTLDETHGGTGQATITQGDILYGSGANTLSKLGAGTSGEFLQTLGVGANPAWATISKAARYFEPDGTAIIQFDNGSKGTDIANNTLTVTGATDADLVAGVAGNQCYNLDGTNDYVLVAHNANQAGLTALTIEALVYLDTANATNAILYNVTNSYITLYFTATNIKGRIVTADGTEEWDVAHSLASNGVGQWLYVVITWDSASTSVVYLNGASLGTGNDAGNGAISDSAAGVNIGADESNTNKWDGKIDGVRVLRRKMSAAEVASRYDILF